MQKNLNSIVDPIHFFEEQNFNTKMSLNEEQIHVVTSNDNKTYLLIKKSEYYDYSAKYSFINLSEKSFELIHPSIINLSGYSIEKPYLYYKYIDYQNFDEIELSDINIQIMFLGIASGISYLLFKGFNYSNFSINSIIFDKNNFPRLIDYINFENQDTNSEVNLINKYIDILNIVINKKKSQNVDFQLNSQLELLIERCKKDKNEFPTFDDFIDFFKTTSYCTNKSIIERKLFKKYLDILQLTDTVVYSPILFDDEEPKKCESIEEIFSYFYHHKDLKKLENKEYFYLNALPEYHIKALVKFVPFLSEKLMNYLYYEDLSLVFTNWNRLIYYNCEQHPFTIYKELMVQIEILQKQKNDTIYLTKKMREIECKIDAISIQAIHYLKKASKMSADIDIKIELASQYVNGDILPCNYKKASEVLDSIFYADTQTRHLIEKIKNKILKMEESELVVLDLPNYQKEILKKANNGEVFYILYVAFALYTGFNNFPILRPLSIEYYRIASKKSSHAMTFLGFLYYKGIFFPKNLKRARNCFKRAAESGNIKAGILDGLLRKYLWRIYLVDFNIEDIFSHYLPSLNSIFKDDTLAFPVINYCLTNDLDKNKLLILSKNKSELPTDINSGNFGMSLCIRDKLRESFIIESKDTSYECMNTAFSEKTILSYVKFFDTNKKNEQLNIAKSFFNGDNNFPINYYVAMEFFKQAAENNDSEAQWRYAMLYFNSEIEKNIGLKYIVNKFDLIRSIKCYFGKSIQQNNLKAKFLNAMVLLEENDIDSFKKEIGELCESGNPDAMYFYGMKLEEEDKSLEQSKELYLKAIEQGHFDSFIRYINALKIKSEMELYESYLEFSVGILNEWFLVKLINFYDQNKRYDQSNILIKIGIKYNYQLFSFFYADHLLYGKGMEPNIDVAEKIAILAYNEKFKRIYWKKYVLIILEVFIRKNEHKKAAKFLVSQKEEINIKYRRKFLSFFQRIDKNLAKYYFINAHFADKNYQACHEILMMLRKKGNINTAKIITDLKKLVDNKNPYAMAILGKIYKQGKYTSRDLKKAIKYFGISAQNGCPLGYYYLGKEYLYGRFLNQKIKKAKQYLFTALENNGEPRAGYYLFKMSKIAQTQEDVEFLKVSAYFGYSKALYKYGYRLITGKDERIPKDKSKGIELIKQSAYQDYNKAIKYCKIHHISFKIDNDDLSIKEDDDQSFELSSFENDDKSTSDLSI